MTYFPDYTSAIYVCSDASKNAIGGIAYQVKTFKRDYETLVDQLLVNNEDAQISAKYPVFPKSGNKCPKFLIFQFSRPRHSFKRKD